MRRDAAVLEQPLPIHRRRMRARVFCLFALAALLGAALFAPATASASIYCTVRGFQARVFQGPTQGMVLTGNITLRVDGDGSLSGSLLSEDRQVLVNLVGRTREQAVFLDFDMGYSGSTHRVIFGLGVLSKPFTDCSPTMVGLLIGPQSGDRGIWYVDGG
ncbi:MAG: hypothetical protein IT319_21790 [Anaerolineae bacterium]|nr:hypothetical protein [Anaerolineae bacterium]